MINKISIDKLKVGMYIHALAKEDGIQEEPFMNTLHCQDSEEIEGLRDQGYHFVYVYIPEGFVYPDLKPKADETPKELDVEEFDIVELVEVLEAEEAEVIELAELVEVEEVEETKETKPQDSAIDLIDPVLYDEEVQKAVELKQEARCFVENLMNDVRSGKGVETEKAQEVVEKMIDSVFRNHDALLSLSRLKDYDNYTFGHSVNVCVISLALGRHMGMPKETLSVLGVGTILHDVGKTRLPDSILNKPSKLTDEEMQEMRNHPTYGMEILSDTKGITGEAINVAYEHHERYDGSGYPRGLAGKNISYFGRLAAITDVYDAMTTPRVYGDTPLPTEAVKRIFDWRRSHFDHEIVDKFVLCLGIYPVGSPVRLSTGEVALVKSSSMINLLKPKVVIVFNRDMKRYENPREVDLAREKETTIVSGLDPAYFTPEKMVKGG